MSDDEKALLEIHRKFKAHGFSDYKVEIRKSGNKLLVTIFAGKIYRFEIDNLID